MSDAHPNAPGPEENKNLPAKPISDTEKQRARMEALMAAVEQRHDMLTTLLKDTGITFDKFVEVFRRAIIRGQAQPATNLLRADAGSVIEACINACTDGLLPDGRQGAIVLYNTVVKRRGGPDEYVLKANWQPMVQGLLDIAYKSGNFRSIEARVVYDGDMFEYAHGDDGFIRHRPKPRPAGVAQPLIVAAYAVAKTVNGGVFREVFEGADIAKVNAVSKATKGPGKAWPEEMARKGPVRRMWKYLPKSPAMNRIVERDNDGFDLDDDALEAMNAPVPERKLRAGFGSGAGRQSLEGKGYVALGEGADPVMPAMEVDDGGLREPLHDEREADPSTVQAEEQRAREAPLEGADHGGGGEAEAGEGEDEPPGISSVDAGGERGGPAAPPTEGAAFQSSLAAAQTWLAVKQALKTLAKSEYGQQERVDAAAKAMAWARLQELGDKTDFVLDPFLFECWLLGADPDHDSVEGNWAIVQQDKAYGRLPDVDKERISARVGEALSTE